MKTLAARHIVLNPEMSEGSAKARPRASIDVVGGISDYGPLLSCWEAIDGRARMILSRQGEVIAQGNGARKFFDGKDCLALGGKPLTTSTIAADKRLQRIFNVAVGTVVVETFAKRTGEGHYLIAATGITANAVAMALRIADDTFVAVFADLEEAFGLTRCEVLVLEQLMHGQVPQQIAEGLAISVHTVRAHLRHCYDKLQVSSREELWQRLGPYRLN
jgi:DNA-binding CsgD family transcriptional regulator